MDITTFGRSPRRRGRITVFHRVSSRHVEKEHLLRQALNDPIDSVEVLTDDATGADLYVHGVSPMTDPTVVS